MVQPDDEIGQEGFTYRLESGDEDTIHIDRVLEYNREPEFMRGLMAHRLTVEAISAVKASPLSKREIIRRLGTSASQFYRLLDPSNSSKSIGQLIALLSAAGREVDFVVRESRGGGPGSALDEAVGEDGKCILE
jgi:predicted XRE-type DNA-binding protein